MPAAKFAKDVVSQISGSSPSRWIWAGSDAGLTFWLVRTLLFLSSLRPSTRSLGLTSGFYVVVVAPWERPRRTSTALPRTHLEQAY